jgi:sterol desaturase/sphingolipid hydroxylase (fatty acid hydroxylase superfamily)
LNIDQLIAEVWLFQDPVARIYYLNLLTAALIALILIKIGKTPGAEFFTLSYWTQDSSRGDIKIMLFNGFFKTLLIAPWLISTMVVSQFLLKLFYLILPNIYWSASPTVQMITFTLLSFVISDFFRFYLHYWMHKSSFLWRFHKVHHSASVLTPFTLYRNHPVEVLLAQFRNILASALSVAIFIFVFKTRVSGLDILGVNALGFIFNALGSNLRHSPIPWSWGVLEKIFISPKQHQIHHDQREMFRDKNFGVCLSLWDRLMGSISYSHETERIQLPNYQQHKLSQLLTLPFKP